MMADSLDPWKEVIVPPKEVNIDDGWAHGGDSSEESILRELKGMVENDRHERFFERWEKQLQEQAEAKQQKIEEALTARGFPGFMEETFTVMTDSEIKEKMRNIAMGRIPVHTETSFSEGESAGENRMAKYS